MPSDPSGVNPKGVLTRAAADFFDDNVGYGSYWDQNTVAGMDLYVSVSLYNDSNTGIALKVYGVTAQNDSGFGTFGYFTKGTPLGSLISQGQNIRPDQGTPYGQIWALTNIVAPGSPNPNPLPVGRMQFGCPGFSGESWFSPFPIAIVPVGYAFVLVNSTGTGTVGAGFWYQQANE